MILKIDFRRSQGVWKMKRINSILILFTVITNILFAQENFNKQIDRMVDRNYCINSYYDVLKSQNRDSIRLYGNIYNDIKYEEPEGWVTRKWYDETVFPFDMIYLISKEKRTDNIFRIGSTTVTVLDCKDYGNYFNLTVQHGAYDNKIYDNCTLLNWEAVRNLESTIVSSKKKWDISFPVYINEFVFKEDGDYLYIYYMENGNQILFATFVSMDDITLNQFKNLIYTNKCDLSQVTWPRHADGTCDYEDNKKSVTASKSSSISKTEAIIQSEVSTPATNVSVKKTMSVSENLKLRAGEATSTQVLTVMSAGTKVKILELGKAETIDGINSNWVKVEVISGRDRDGKDIKKKTTGWCYGGYLE